MPLLKFELKDDRERFECELWEFRTPDGLIDSYSMCQVAWRFARAPKGQTDHPDTQLERQE